jgi:hypothetical protein
MSRFVAPEAGIFPDAPKATLESAAKREAASETASPDVLASWVAEIILDHEHDRPRSRQMSIGPSAVGNSCDRALAFDLASVEAVNFPDPLKAYVGTGLHAMLEAAVRLRDRETNRYLVEHEVTYRGITGKVDLFDRLTGRAIDWKSKELSKINRLRGRAMSYEYLVQQQIYAAGLRAQGENVKSVSLVFIPVNGLLRDILTQTVPVDVSVADIAIDRLEGLSNRLMDGATPSLVEAMPNSLCPWCSHYAPDSPLSARSCPGLMAPVADLPPLIAPPATPPTEVAPVAEATPKRRRRATKATTEAPASEESTP